MNCIIVDDEPNAVDLLKTFINKYRPKVKVIGEFYTLRSAFQGITKLKPDFIFLDIKIGNQTGFQLLDKFETLDFDIIFTTAYNEYSLEAFDYGAIHYLVKPINIGKFELAIDRLQPNRGQIDRHSLNTLRNMLSSVKTQKIALPNQYGNEFIEIDDIQYCEASGSYSILHMVSGEEKIISKPLGYLENQLDENVFCRTHKKYLVNTNEIIFIHKGKTATCILNGGRKIPVSVNFKTKLKNLIERKIIF